MNITRGITRAEQCMYLIEEVYEDLELPVFFDDNDVYFYTDDEYGNVLSVMALNSKVGFKYDIFEDEIEDLKRGEVLGYVSRFASQGKVTRSATRECVEAMFTYAKWEGLTYLIAAVTPAHARVHTKLNGWEHLTETRVLEKYNKELILIGRAV